MFHTRLQVACAPDFTEILIAETAEAGFDTFLETEEGFEAYAEEENYDKDQLAYIQKKYAHVHPFVFQMDRIKKQNWNEEWEKNLTPILVEETCLIRAEFHKVDRSYPYEIIITPKMSFGTGHHQTTYLMIKNQLAIDHKDKRVMDAGCGTAILSIMASKLGATQVEAFDIDEWSVVNGKENIENNHCNNINLQQGNIQQVALSGVFDILLANINKNVLLAELWVYSKFLTAGGLLLLSGFYAHDVADLVKHSVKFGFSEVKRDERETWAALLLRKS